MARPGIMLYFDILEPIKMLSDEDKGLLLVAMLEYGRDGILPEFEGPLGIVWSFVQPMIDKDGLRYDDMKLQREYAAFCKKRKKIWMSKIPFDDWVVMSDNERQRAVDPVASRNPTTTTTATNNINEQLTTNNINLQLQPQYTTNNCNDHLHQQAATATAESEMRFVHGELGRGVVILNEDQTESLLDYMGIDAFDHYVRKLADFIIKNNATVKNHYDTILRWWKEDSGVH